MDLSAVPGFDGKPGAGNAYIAGKFDSGSSPCQQGRLPPPCSAVFFQLAKLNNGDQVILQWEGKRYDFTVNSKCWLPRTAQFDQVVKNTADAVLTLSTAAGTLDPEKHTYSHNLVVRAVQNAATSPITCNGGQTEPLPTQAPTDTAVTIGTVSPLVRGGTATVTATTRPGVGCSLSLSRSGLTLVGLSAPADGGGQVRFSWTVGPDIATGPATLSVSCDQGRSLSREVTIS
jgi:hypothetical protein